MEFSVRSSYNTGRKEGIAMLAKMYLTNFLSFCQRTEFDFTASKYEILADSNLSKDGKHTKGAMFIGPNAAGKSNALKGISLLIDLIKGEGARLTNYAYRFADISATKLEYEFCVSGKAVFYEINDDHHTNTLQESLRIENTEVLSRSGSHGELHIGTLSVAEDNLDKNTLFLRTASFNTGRFPQEPILRELMTFLLNSYSIDGYNQLARTGENVLKFAEENGVETLNEYLKALNYDFYLEYGKFSQSMVEGIHYAVGSPQKRIFFKRNNFPVPVLFRQETQGNQVFADLLPQLIQVIEQPGMLVIDEFGNSLHNRLAERIIRFFMENAVNSQFFFTSHDTNLISNSVLRPDQIHVISFEGKDGSTVQRISKFGPREAQNLEKMYLGGMFEGLPMYDDVSD